jgi:hypothetical protein
MCEDHAAAAGADDGDVRAGHDHPEAGAALSRRQLMQGAGVAAAGLLAPRLASGPPRPVERLAPRAAGRARTFDATAAYSMAMHVHSSFSEQSGSMDAQLYQASTNAVDVLWWTDHDGRMLNLGYRKTVHFTSLTNEVPPAGEGGPWKWVKRTAGPVASTSTGGIVASPSSPNDPVVGGALEVRAKSKSTVAATYGYFANSHGGGDSYKNNLNGQAWTFDVMLASGWSRGYLELLMTLSLHEATSGRPAGVYTISYRFAPSGATGRGVTGIAGRSTQVVAPGGWVTVTLRPDQDIPVLWPDMDVRDFQISGLTVSAVSTGDTVTAYVDYLRITRALSGSAALTMQQDIAQELALTYPSVTQVQGLEISKQLPHINWFGSGVTMTDYTAPGAKQYASYLRTTVVPSIHKSGGLASYNHPYGYAEGTLLPLAQQQALLAQVAPGLLGNKLLGCDLLEVGYNVRQGVGLGTHLALWDVLSRNSIFVTGTGTNDDHYGADWRGIVNNFYTQVWASGLDEPALLAGLRSGRAWCAPLGTYGGALDLLVDDEVPMGGVSVSSVTNRQLAVSATALPPGSTVQVVRGPVDNAGTGNPTPGTSVIGSMDPSGFGGGGQAVLALDTSTSSFVRVQVVDATGTIVGVSNPVWLLRSAPPGGVPAARAY